MEINKTITERRYKKKSNFLKNWRKNHPFRTTDDKNEKAHAKNVDRLSNESLDRKTERINDVSAKRGGFENEEKIQSEVNITSEFESSWGEVMEQNKLTTKNKCKMHTYFCSIRGPH